MSVRCRKCLGTPILVAATLLTVLCIPVASSVSSSVSTGLAGAALPQEGHRPPGEASGILPGDRDSVVATTLASSRSSISGRAESEPVPSITVRTLVSGLTIPWDIAFTPNGTMLYTQRSGVLSSRLKDGTVRTVTADMSDLFASGETGLMAIVVDPEFETNRRFYTCQGHSGPEVQVIAWTMNSDFSVATRASDPLVGGIPADATDGRHGGCRLRFGPAGYLWIATGDAAVGTHPQDASSLGGKVLRVNSATGTAADGNPTAGSLVYSYGHRNVQGLALRPGTNEMWSIEHGPTFDDEINRPFVFCWDEGGLRVRL